MRGYWDEAIRRGEQALESARNLRDEAAIVRFGHNTAITFQNRGELEEARRLYSESLEIEKRLGNQSGIASTLGQLGSLAAQEGDRAEGVKLLREALNIFERLKSPDAEKARRMLAQVEDESS